MNEFSATTAIGGSQIADLMCTGLEGGYSPWLLSCEVIKIPEGFVNHERFSPCVQAEFYDGDFQLKFTFDGPNDDEGSFASTKLVGPAEMQAAITLFADNSRSHFGDWMQDESDANTGDVFLQYLCLEEEIYG